LKLDLAGSRKRPRLGFSGPRGGLNFGLAPRGRRGQMVCIVKRLVFLCVMALTLAGRAAPASEGSPYYLVFLRPDPNRIPLHQSLREAIMAEHLANIQKMADEGILAAAGPMDDETTTISGIFVLKADSLGDAQRIAASDPTVLVKRNTVDVHPWWGPKGIGDGYFQWKRSNPGAKDVMAAHAFCILLRMPASAGPATADPGDSAFVESLRESGALLAAGRIDGDPVIAEVVIFKTASIDEARRSLASDPGVAAGRLQPEFHNWWTADRVMPW
jgi:uncharacterized protein YciI